MSKFTLGIPKFLKKIVYGNDIKPKELIECTGCKYFKYNSNGVAICEKGDEYATKCIFNDRNCKVSQSNESRVFTPNIPSSCQRCANLNRLSTDGIQFCTRGKEYSLECKNHGHKYYRTTIDDSLL